MALTEPTVMHYEELKAFPVGTVIEDRQTYWKALRRHYVKTTDNTWAAFFHAPDTSEIAEVVSERRNNVSPGPLGILAIVVR